MMRQRQPRENLPNPCVPGPAGAFHPHQEQSGRALPWWSSNGRNDRALRDILVLINPGERSEARVRLACALAARHGSQVIGLRCAAPFSRLMIASDPTAGLLIADLLSHLRAQASDTAAGLEAAFREQPRRKNLPGEWRYVEAVACDHAPLHARYVDLVVLGRPADSDRLVEEMLFHAGRPVLVVPNVGSFTDAGRHVLIGWNAGREATRAVHDALPILEKADSVTVFAANPSGGVTRSLLRHMTVPVLFSH